MRLLCADDDPDIRTILRLALSVDPTLEVVIVDSGQAVLHRAAATQFDGILLDVMMPELDGYETCRRLKGAPGTASVPVVFLTAKSQPAELQRALEAGGLACLTKPFDPLTLAADVRALLDQVDDAGRLGSSGSDGA
jgi:CheY-like chemotaxis protein